MRTVRELNSKEQKYKLNRKLRKIDPGNKSLLITNCFKNKSYTDEPTAVGKIMPKNGHKNPIPTQTTLTMYKSTDPNENHNTET